MLKQDLQATKAVSKAVDVIAKRLRYNGAEYQRFYTIYHRDKEAGAYHLEHAVRRLSLFDIEHYGKTDKYHYRLATAMFDLLDWNKVAAAVVAWSVEDAESRNPNKSYKGYTRG